MLNQLGVQFIGVFFTLVYTAIVAYIILEFICRFVSIHVKHEEEVEGLDIVSHDEHGYDF